MNKYVALTNYCDYYIYDRYQKKIIIKYGDDSESAMELYNTIKPSYYDDNQYFDIALDYYRIRPKLREQLRNHFQPEYYSDILVKAARYYREKVDGTRFQEQVLKYLLSFCNEMYDVSNEMVIQLFETIEFEEIYAVYGKKHKDIFQSQIEELKNNSEYSVDKVVNSVKLMILKVEKSSDISTLIGKYKNKFCMTTIDKNLIENLKRDMVLYPVECNQFLTLLKLGILEEFISHRIRSSEECKKYIDETLGLREEYVQVLGDAFMEVFGNCIWLQDAELTMKTEQKLVEEDVAALDFFSNMTLDELYELPYDSEQREEIIKALKEYNIPIDYYNTTIEYLGFGCHAYRAVKRSGIDRVGDYIKDQNVIDTEKILYTRNLGRKAYEQIVNMLQEMGFVLIETKS